MMSYALDSAGLLRELERPCRAWRCPACDAASHGSAKLRHEIDAIFGKHTAQLPIIKQLTSGSIPNLMEDYSTQELRLVSKP